MNKQIYKCMSLTLVAMIAGNPLLGLASGPRPELSHTSVKSRPSASPNRTPASLQGKHQEGAVAGQSTTLLPNGSMLRIGGSGGDGVRAPRTTRAAGTGAGSHL